MKLALQLTAIDMLSGVVERAKRHILSLGPAGQSVKKDFDDMTRHIGSAMKNIAVANYAVHKIGAGVKPAADLQESLIDVRMSLMRSGKDAAVLNAELGKVRSTAVDLQKITPFSAQDVVEVQKEFLNSGLEFEKVIGNGATRAAMMLATITKETPKAASDAMLNIGIPYHLKSNEYGQVADVIQRHAMSGRMKLPALNAALPYVAPVAKNFKVPWHDLLTGLAVLGEQGQLGSMAGTHLKDFYGRLTGASRISRRYMSAVNQDLVRKGHSPMEFWDKQGEMKPTQDLIKTMRDSLGNYNTKNRMLILEKIFGEQGGLAAMALMSKGTGSWEFIKEKVEEVAGAEDKMNERLKGFNANVIALGGTAKTTLATMFDPMLAPLTLVTQKMNDIVDGVGKLAEAHPVLTTTTNALLASTAAYFGIKGATSLIKGGVAGAKVLSGLKGLTGTGLGIAEGKMVQAATGVTPVFVTNWPGTGLPFPGVPGTGAAVAGGAASSFGKYLIPGAMYSLPVAVAAAPFISKFIGDSAKANGWGKRSSRDAESVQRFRC
jgi:TP901 family phage tail tape measure protein